MNKENCILWIVGVVIAAILFYLFLLSNEKQTMLMYVDGCVLEKVNRDMFMGTEEEAWNTYVTECVKEYQP